MNTTSPASFQFILSVFDGMPSALKIRREGNLLGDIIAADGSIPVTVNNPVAAFPHAEPPIFEGRVRDAAAHLVEGDYVLEYGSTRDAAKRHLTDALVHARRATREAVRAHASEAGDWIRVQHEARVAEFDHRFLEEFGGPDRAEERAEALRKAGEAAAHRAEKFEKVTAAARVVQEAQQAETDIARDLARVAYLPEQ